MALHRFFFYFGSKAQLGRHYPPPRHETIVEPFAGGAGYSLWYPHARVTLMDKDPQVVALWRYLTAASEREILRLPLLERNQQVSDLQCGEVERLLISRWVAAAPHGAQRFGGYAKADPEWWWSRTVRARLASQVSKIRHWKVIDGSYHDAPDVESTWFIDPPYEVAGKTYTCGSQEIDFEHLGAWCRSRRGQVIVCENDGATWLPFRPFRRVKSMGNRATTEAIWTNETQDQA